MKVSYGLMERNAAGWDFCPAMAEVRPCSATPSLHLMNLSFQDTLIFCLKASQLEQGVSCSAEDFR